MPVYQGDLDNVVGIVNTKDLFHLFSLKGLVVLEDALYPPLFLKPGEDVTTALELFRKARRPMALVRNDQGKIVGLLTLEDVLEEIVGDIEDEHDIEQAEGLLVMLEDGLWEADARVELEELAKAVDPRLSSEEDEVDTLGGLVFLIAGHIPAKGETVTHPSGWKLEAIDSDPRRIIRVRLHSPEERASEA
jgi:CBS domain containing-hemolysin-like protein